MDILYSWFDFIINRTSWFLLYNTRCRTRHSLAYYFHMKWGWVIFDYQQILYPYFLTIYPYVYVFRTIPVHYIPLYYPYICKFFLLFSYPFSTFVSLGFYSFMTIPFIEGGFPFLLYRDSIIRFFYPFYRLVFYILHWTRLDSLTLSFPIFLPPPFFFMWSLTLSVIISSSTYYFL